MCEKTREKLLLEADDLTLGRAVETVLQVETAMECTSQLAGARAPSRTELQSSYSLPITPACTPPTTVGVQSKVSRYNSRRDRTIGELQRYVVTVGLNHTILRHSIVLPKDNNVETV